LVAISIKARPSTFAGEGSEQESGSVSMATAHQGTKAPDRGVRAAADVKDPARRRYRAFQPGCAKAVTRNDSIPGPLFVFKKTE
jgi:hypothetical protein